MIINPMLGMPQGAEWLVILVVVVLIFGAAKLPELARGTGQALRIFKAETKGLRDDDKTDERGDVPPPASTTPTSTMPDVAPGELPPGGSGDPTSTDPRRDTHNG